MSVLAAKPSCNCKVRVQLGRNEELMRSCLPGVTVPRAVDLSVLRSDPVAVPVHGAGPE